MWSLPNPEPIQDRLQADSSSLRELLEDVEIELLAYSLILTSEQGVTPVTDEGWSSANQEIERTLGAQGCMFQCAPFDTASS